MTAFTMQPMAGAHGELTGIMMMAAYHRDRGNKKKVILIPDSAHGTNPASAAIAGYTVKAIASDANGLMSVEARLWRALEGGKVDCDLCAHLCRIAPTKFGVFRM